MCKANRCLFLCQMTRSKVHKEVQGESDRRIELQNELCVQKSEWTSITASNSPLHIVRL